MRVWTTGQPIPDDGQPVQLVKLGADGQSALVASHDQPVVATTVFERDGQSYDMAGLLTQANLLRTDVLEYAGNELCQRVARGEVARVLAEDIQPGTRIVLQLEHDSLAALPWELLRLDGERLFVHKDVPWLLGSLEVPRPQLGRGQVPLTFPVRILIVVGDERGDPAVQGDEELRRIESQLHRRGTEVLLRVLERPSLQVLEATLEEFSPHVFHFIGHGAMHRGKPAIQIWSRDIAGKEIWDAERIRTVLGGMRVPRLVILNACDTIDAATQSAWSLVQAFVDKGVGAVLAMQAEIRGDAAVAFSEYFYKRLVAGDVIDMAFTKARTHLATSALSDSPNQREQMRANWPVPRLLVRGRPEDVIDLSSRVDPGPGKVRAQADFVDRWNQRWQVWQCLRQESGPGLDHERWRIPVITGPETSGKSEFLSILGETWIRAGACALHVDLDHRDETSRMAIVIDRLEAVARDAGLSSDGLAALDRNLDSQEMGHALFAELDSLASERPLLIMLDGLHDWNRNTLQGVILPALWNPYQVRGSGSRVHLVVALRDDMVPGDLDRDTFLIIAVNNFSSEEWRRAGGLFVRWHTDRVPDDKRALFTTKAWPVAELQAPGELADPGKTRYEALLLDMVRYISRRHGGPR